MKNLIAYDPKWYHAIPSRDPKFDDKLLAIIFTTLAVVNIGTLVLTIILAAIS